MKTILKILVLTFIGFSFCFSTCKYGFKDTAPIPADIQSFRVNYFENKAQYINPQISPQLTERVKSKIISNTRLNQSNRDDADYDISGYFTQYYTTTVGISGGSQPNSTTNRLTVGFHLIFKNNKDLTKNFEADLIRTFDFSSQLSLTEAENTLTEEIVKNMADEVFNKIFSNW